MKRASEAMANKYKISTRRVYQIWRETHPPIDPRELVSQPINIGSISSTKTNRKNKVSINKAIHSEVLPNESVELTQPKIQSFTSPRVVKKSVSSDNTSRRKSDLEKLLKDTEKLAPICPSLPQ
ncbi:3919_t:CDS:1 [Gigaspora margarita]|uniref:3919_t:CDS:1 n=1 Tax=Gigaspora margarita TaxID=4874 RepID=A0ABN7VZJ6_GIGMA|nr:3919_t:CDS:1 [Gigaspora margarita]